MVSPGLFSVQHLSPVHVLRLPGFLMTQSHIPCQLFLNPTSDLDLAFRKKVPVPLQSKQNLGVIPFTYCFLKKQARYHSAMSAARQLRHWNSGRTCSIQVAQFKKNSHLGCQRNSQGKAITAQDVILILHVTGKMRVCQGQVLSMSRLAGRYIKCRYNQGSNRTVSSSFAQEAPSTLVIPLNIRIISKRCLCTAPGREAAPVSPRFLTAVLGYPSPNSALVTPQD